MSFSLAQYPLAIVLFCCCGMRISVIARSGAWFSSACTTLLESTMPMELITLPIPLVAVAGGKVTRSKSLTYAIMPFAAISVIRALHDTLARHATIFPLPLVLAVTTIECHRSLAMFNSVEPLPFVDPPQPMIDVNAMTMLAATEKSSFIHLISAAFLQLAVAMWLAIFKLAKVAVATASILKAAFPKDNTLLPLAPIFVTVGEYCLAISSALALYILSSVRFAGAQVAVAPITMKQTVSP
mmetsp:Transcript_29401/g.57533  ORF Transcript_29401/g.57533 Transcript_29401/m.57533 type:complete len:241 (-) Transcript_29401:922-1644(-)